MAINLSVIDDTKTLTIQEDDSLGFSVIADYGTYILTDEDGTILTDENGSILRGRYEIGDVINDLDVTDSLISMTLSDDESLTFEWSSNTSSDVYVGTYEVTPTQSTQTLLTSDKLMPANVVINPIPSNYGLITYDGSKLTIT